MGITFSYGPDLVEEIDWRKRVEFSLTHHGATLRVEPNKIDSLFVSALGLLFFSFALWNGAPLGVVVFPLVIVVGGICSYLTRVTYLLEPGVIERQVKFLGWTRKRTFTPGRLVLAVSHDDEEAPEVSVWRWEVKIESDGKGPVMIGNSVMGRHARINMDRARNCLVALAEASFWPTDVRMIYCRQPRRSAHR